MIQEVAAMLARRRVSPEIIERVVRLNPTHREGERLRGFHYKRHLEDVRWMYDWMGKGEFLRRFGAEAFARISPRNLRKVGRRVYVPRQAMLR